MDCPSHFTSNQYKAKSLQYEEALGILLFFVYWKYCVFFGFFIVVILKDNSKGFQKTARIVEGKKTKQNKRTTELLGEVMD